MRFKRFIATSIAVIAATATTHADASGIKYYSREKLTGVVASAATPPTPTGATCGKLVQSRNGIGGTPYNLGKTSTTAAALALCNAKAASLGSTKGACVWVDFTQIASYLDKGSTTSFNSDYWSSTCS